MAGHITSHVQCGIEYLKVIVHYGHVWMESGCLGMTALVRLSSLCIYYIFIIVLSGPKKLSQMVCWFYGHDHCDKNAPSFCMNRSPYVHCCAHLCEIKAEA